MGGVRSMSSILSMSGILDMSRILSPSSINVEAMEQSVATTTVTQRCHSRCTCVGCKQERGAIQRRRRIGYAVGALGLLGILTMITWYVWNMAGKIRKHKGPGT